MNEAGGDSSRRRAWPAASAELIARLNSWWRIAGPPPSESSFKQRLAYPARRALARLLGPQETFNSAVVQYINGTASIQQAVLDECESALDEVQRYREALLARERRMTDAVSALHAQQEELRTAVAALRQAAQAASVRSRDTAPASAAAPASGAGASLVPAPDAALHGHVDALSHNYVGFEDQFRGDAETIRARLAEYVPRFAGAADVLDIGCGRGEFLTLLRQHGVSARGIDLNEAMVAVCQEQGLDARRADALSYLRAQPDGALGGLFAAQVVEHLEPAYLTQLLDAAFDKLRPGSTIVLETINPGCWFAFFESYIRDITHVRPLHPDTLRFLLVATGFQQIEIEYRAPYPEHEKLQPVGAVAVLGDSAETLNANVDKLNRLLFTYLDYAAVGRRP